MKNLVSGAATLPMGDRPTPYPAERQEETVGPGLARQPLRGGQGGGLARQLSRVRLHPHVLLRVASAAAAASFVLLPRRSHRTRADVPRRRLAAVGAGPHGVAAAAGTHGSGPQTSEAAAEEPRETGSVRPGTQTRGSDLRVLKGKMVKKT